MEYPTTLEPGLMTTLWHQVTDYVAGLDWPYILTFTVIAYGLTHWCLKNGWKAVTRRRSRTKYRIAVVGLLYGIALFYIRGYALQKVESLLASYAFALLFHELIIEGVMRFLGRNVLPDRWNKKLLGDHPPKPPGHEQK